MERTSIKLREMPITVENVLTQFLKRFLIEILVQTERKRVLLSIFSNSGILPFTINELTYGSIASLGLRLATLKQGMTPPRIQNILPANTASTIAWKFIEMREKGIPSISV